jgi:two-component system, chemotaxis family, protein-glutamate methylesterase/glutaminase
MPTRLPWGPRICMAQTTRDIVVIGASAGGVQALQRLMSALPGDFPAAIFVVVHVWPSSTSFLASILGRAGPLPVAEARDGDLVQPGKILVAPPDLHLLLEKDRVAVVRGPRENRTRPAINPLFRSAANVYGPRVIGVILTGTLDDGSAGLWAVKRCGGLGIVQSDPQFDEMPRSAVENAPVDHHVPLDEIPRLLDRLVREPIAVTTAATVPEAVRLNDKAMKMQPNEINLDKLGQRSVFSCPECNGALWELEEGGLHYRCHVGHMYSAESLKESQGLNIEQSLWSALRALKESAALDQRLAERAEQHQLDQAANRYRESADEKMEQVTRLQDFLATLPPAKSA